MYRIPRWLYLSPDQNTGGGSGAADDKTKAGDDDKSKTGSGGGTGDVTQDKDKDGTKPDQDKDKPNPDADKKFSQEDINRAVTKRLDEERVRQERKADEEKGEFKKLYESEKSAHEATKSELEALKPTRDHVNNAIEAEVKEWPKELKAMDPGTENIQARLKWVENSRALVTQLKNSQKAPITNHGAGGGGNGGGQKPTDPTESYLNKQYVVPGQAKDKPGTT